MFRQLDDNRLPSIGTTSTPIPFLLTLPMEMMIYQPVVWCGEIAGWGGSSWVCVSDATLSLSDIQSMLSNNAVDLNSGSTIGGLQILTVADDSDTLADLSCVSDGEIARYDLVQSQWYCDSDADWDNYLVRMER